MGMSIFEYSKRLPDVSNFFDEAMEGLAALGSAAILAAHGFSELRTLVDVGGGNGALLATLDTEVRRLLGKADYAHSASHAE
jgi:O-methyltransferase domain